MLETGKLNASDPQAQLKRKSVTLYLPDDNVTIYIIKELMREERPFTYFSDRPKVQLFQNNMKLTDDTILSECTSTKIEYNVSNIPPHC